MSLPAQKKKRRTLSRDRKCLYCIGKTEPDYKQIEVLAKLISERGKLLGGDRTGVCSKHQRRVAKSVKRARHLALLPFLSGI